MIAGLKEAKLSRNRKLKVRFFPGVKIEDSYYYLVPLLKKKADIILDFGTNDTPYKNEDEIYKELKSKKDYKQGDVHLAKYIYISNNVTVRQQKYLKKYVEKLKVVEEKSVIQHDNILSSHLSKNGLHVSSYGTIKLAEKIYIKNSDLLM